MAQQRYDRDRNCFFLDLHGVLKRDAARVITKRVEECNRYGIGAMEVVYGTPDFYEGSIASALHEVVLASPHVESARLPREFVEDCESFVSRIAKVNLSIRCTVPPVRDPEMEFAPFPASREPDPWLRRKCENPFRPLKRSFTSAEAAKFIGQGGRAEHIPLENVSLAQLESLCRSWKRPEKPLDVSPHEEAVIAKAPGPEDLWYQLWNEAAEDFAAGRLADAHDKLERCMDLSGQSSDALLLARTLGAMGVLMGEKKDLEHSLAYYHSAIAAISDVPGEDGSDRMEIESRFVKTLLDEGRFAEAAGRLHNLRLEVETRPVASAAQKIYVYTSEASVRSQLGDDGTAVDLLRRAIAVVEATPDLGHFVSAELRLRAGLLESRQSHLRPALSLLTQAAEEFELLQAAAPAQRFLCWREIAAVADQLGHHDRAERILRELVNVSVEPGSPAELARIAAITDLGNVYLRKACWKEAEATYREAGEQLKGCGAGEALVVDVHQNLGSVYTHSGRYEQAEAEFGIALDLASKLYPRQHPAVAQIIRNTAVLYQRTGRYEQAIEANRKALAMYAACGSPPSFDQAYAHNGLGALLIKAGDLDEAEYHLRLALSINTGLFGEGHSETARPMIYLGHALRARGSATQARTMFTLGIRILEDARCDPALLAEGYFGLSEVQRHLRQEREAKKSSEKANYYLWAARQKPRG